MRTLAQAQALAKEFQRQTKKTNRVIRVGTNSDLGTALTGIESPSEKE
jgi:hypothetical protein